MSKSVYDFDSYKAVMSGFLLGEGRRGQLSRAAETLGCQPSFLSRVIKSEIHLTPDQAFLLGRFWGLDDEGVQYFQMLVERDRASNNHYRLYLEKKLATLKAASESIQVRVKKPEFAVHANEALYFSSWLWSALHFLTAVPEYQKTSALTARLGLSGMQIEAALEQLQHLGLVRNLKGQWVYNGGQFHIPKNSPFVVLHHQNWRARAVLDSQSMENTSIHYTTVLTLSLNDFERLRRKLLEFISESESIARPSKPEECVALICDLFKI